jgi:hypothetical protein
MVNSTDVARPPTLVVTPTPIWQATMVEADFEKRQGAAAPAVR